MTKETAYPSTISYGCVDQKTAVLANATFDGSAETAPKPGDPVPPLWHWFAFPPDARTEDLNTDGHPVYCDFALPAGLKRRMWASGQLNFLNPLKIGETITKSSKIMDISEKSSRAGDMVFVTYHHAISGEAGLAIEETQNIVYLAMPKSYTPPKIKTLPENSKKIANLKISPALLFRYSALTFNAHRIHYDLDYVKHSEKYPHLVIHGPLQATLLMNAAVKVKGMPPSRFDFRGVHPAFAHEPLDIVLSETPTGCDLFTASNHHQCLQAQASWETKA